MVRGAHRLTLQTSFLTPPVGFAIFYLRGVCPSEVTLMHICKGVVPIIIIQVLGIIITAVWPGLVLWLPMVAY